MAEYKLSEYEIQRQKRIKENHDFMRSLGLPVPKTPRIQKPTTTSKPKKKRKVFSSLDSDSSSESSDDSDDMDWVPGVSEEVAKRNKMYKRFVPEFRPKRNLLFDINKTQSQKTNTKNSSRKDFDDLLKISDQMMNDESLFADEDEKEETHHDTGSRYPVRIRSMKASYREAEVPDDDHYLYCEECQDLYYGDCPSHGALQPFPDKPQPSDNNNDVLTAARASLPDFLEIKPSKIPHAGLGVFCKSGVIPVRAKFGSYKGKKVRLEDIDENMDTSYMWEIMKDGKFSHFVDGSDETSANWMRFVNCSRCEKEQNLVSFQYRGEIYYRSYKQIPQGTELLVWYGDKYANDLGISTKDVDDIDEPLNAQSVNCTQGQSIFQARQSKSNSTEDKDHKCTLCNKRHDTAKEYHEHLRTHCNVKDRVCPVCKKKSTRIDSLMTHLRTHSGYRPYACKQCGKAFTMQHVLIKHERIHSGVKPYRCTYCEKTFTYLHHLKKHERIHTGIKPYECKYCHKAFIQLGDHNKHERIHTGIKPYECKYCHKKFARLFVLKGHERIHTGIKPYECKYCHKAFIQLVSLNNHERTHTGIKPYECKKCHKTFTQSDSLKSHIKHNHS